MVLINISGVTLKSCLPLSVRCVRFVLTFGFTILSKTNLLDNILICLILLKHYQ